MFASIPSIVNGQRNPHPKKCHGCPSRCCLNGYCSWTCYYLTISPTSNAISLQLKEAQNVSGKIYDATGRLIKTLVNSSMPQGKHHIEWNKRDEAGNTVSAGIYILKLDAGIYSVAKKLSVIN